MSLLFAALLGRQRPSHAPATWGCQGDSRGHVLPSQTFLSAGGTGRDWKLTPKSLQLSPTFWGATCKPWVQTPRGTTSQWWGISLSTPFCSPVTFQHFNATWTRKEDRRCQAECIFCFEDVEQSQKSRRFLQKADYNYTAGLWECLSLLPNTEPQIANPWFRILCWGTKTVNLDLISHRREWKHHFLFL